ncbi:MAG: EAL domain-containing protein, partial [bacterium]|nr:EAL domain-containing protein [bacterium]
ISLAHELGLQVVAEGVEKTEQLEFLREHQCDEIQGFIYSKALPEKEFLNFVRNRKSAPA